MKGKTDSRAHPIPRHSGLKTLARSVGRLNRPSIARRAMRDPKVRKVVLNILEKDVQKEMTKMSAKNTKSCLRQRSLEALDSFSWDHLHSELQSKAPTLHRILQGCVNVKRRQRISNKGRRKGKVPRSHRLSNSAVLGVCVQHCC